MQHFIHYFLHLVLPGIIAYIFYKPYWKKAWLILLATMLVDADHLFADPVFDPNRCSIGFHYLHSYYAIALYVLLLLFIKNKIFRLIMIGLLLHMLTDYLDCLWMK